MIGESFLCLFSLPARKMSDGCVELHPLPLPRMFFTNGVTRHHLLLRSLKQLVLNY